MPNEKLLRANVKITAHYPEAIADINAPKVAELNNSTLGFNISCAIEDSYTLNQTDSDTDDSLSICDIGNVETATFINYEASLDGFRDADVAANGVYNLFWRLFKAKGVPFILVKRIGAPNTIEYAEGETVSLFTVETDNSIDLVEDGSMLRLGARFKPQGNAAINVKVVA